MNDQDPERALRRNLRELARVEPDAEATARAIERARVALLATNTRRFNWRKAMSARTLCAVAAALLAIAFVTHWMASFNGTGQFAFGEVQQQLQRTKSVQYTQVRNDRYKDGLAGPEETRRVKILDGHRIREEIKITKPGDPQPEGHMWLTEAEPYISIRNSKTGKVIELFPEKKGYDNSVGIPLAIDLQTGELKVDESPPLPEFDFYKKIREVPVERAKRLADRVIGGKALAGFQVVEKVEDQGGVDTWTRTYWVDPETKLPARIETSFRSTHPISGDSDFVQSEIVFDEPLDEALFSTDPPEGYRDLTRDKAE